MTKTKSTKRALLVSLLALLTCVSMLVGSTFAWFTDSVTSAGNIIKSGTLDVTMEWAEGKEDPATTTWTDASTGAIFNYDKWEPGYTEVRHVKIANEGSLALKYQLSIQANGEVSKLADVIDVYYIDPAIQVADRAALTDANKLGTLTEVLAQISTTASGSLEAGQNHTITIALKMQESAGNEYQEKSIGTDFSVVLMATQKDFESDSFNNQYDANLTPPDEDGDILKEIDGVIYAYNDKGSRLYKVTEAFTGDTLVIAEGTEAIGDYAFSYNANVKNVVLPSSVRSLGRGFDTSTVEKVVLNEGLEQIDSRAFRSTPNLKEVVIPSTVKTIADNAFQKSGIQEIVIPATVETVGETAFGSSKIEKVTFEGNTSIQGYAFRGCPNLRTVIMKGDNNEMIPSTLNGRNSMWFCNGESNNPNTSNITFYVENETVAARVKTAMGAEANNTKIYVDGKITIKVDTADEFNAEIAAATPGTVIDATGVSISASGRPGVTLYDGIAVKGATITNTTLLVDGAASLTGEIVLEGCTFVGTDFTQQTYFQSGANATDVKLIFNNCTFEGQIILAGATCEAIELNNCTFNLNSDGYAYVQCMGGNTEFNGCTFNIAASASFNFSPMTKYGHLNLYSERYTTNVTLNGCNSVAVHKYNVSGGVGNVITK